MSETSNPKRRLFVAYGTEAEGESAALADFKGFTKYLTTSRCHLCKEPFFEGELNVETLFDDWMSGSAHTLSSNINCKSCVTDSCVAACTPTSYTGPSRVSFGPHSLTWCCAGGRLFLIWALLCGFDRYIKNRNHTSKASKPSETESSGKPEQRAQGQPPMASGVGYDVGKISQGLSAAHLLARRQSSEMAGDDIGELILKLLGAVLPDENRAAHFDVDPPGATVEILMNSKLLNYCAELLRNDQLVEISKRQLVYAGLFDFLLTIVSHPGMRRVLFTPHPIHPSPVDLLTLSFLDDVPGSEEQGPALAGYFRSLSAQTDLFLKNAKARQSDFEDEDSKEMLFICRPISYLAGLIKKNNIPPSTEEDTTKSAAVPEHLAVKEVELPQIMLAHNYTPEAIQLEHSPPGRLKRLIIEIATLQSSLPPGIYVRYADDRPDLLKSVIIGPVGTPYENGLFEFDIFCPGKFPNRPPAVNFKGTGGGMVSINPNLYEDGFVCLSLLGTWQGEPWVPGVSTLLQVLISIQAMILCEEPWYNEPGQVASPGVQRSDVYNQEIRAYTVRFALLDWLEDPPMLWKDVMEYHFTQHGNAILKTVEEWTRTRTVFRPLPLPRNTGTVQLDMDDMLSKLQTALKEYGTTFQVTYSATRDNLRSPRPDPSRQGWPFWTNSPSPPPSIPLPPPPSPSSLLPPPLYHPPPPYLDLAQPPSLSDLHHSTVLVSSFFSPYASGLSDPFGYPTGTPIANTASADMSGYFANYPAGSSAVVPPGGHDHGRGRGRGRGHSSLAGTIIARGGSFSLSIGRGRGLSSLADTIISRGGSSLSIGRGRGNNPELSQYDWPLAGRGGHDGRGGRGGHDGHDGAGGQTSS